jgi:hypothetical protein
MGLMMLFYSNYSKLFEPEKWAARAWALPGLLFLTFPDPQFISLCNKMSAGESLIDFLHVSLLSTRSGCVECSTGNIWINYGNVVHAESDTLTGEEAFWKIVEMDTGNREFHMGQRTPSRSITRPTELLLIEAQSKSKMLGEKPPPPPQPGEDLKKRVRKTTSVLFEIKDEPNRKVHILDQGRIILGRSNSADVTVNDATVSRRHLLLEVSEKEVIISNLSSGNGTFLNGEKIQGSVTIKENDIIQVGSSIMRYYRVKDGRAALIQEFEDDLEDTGLSPTGIIPE